MVRSSGNSAIFRVKKRGTRDEGVRIEKDPRPEGEDAVGYIHFGETGIMIEERIGALRQAYEETE